MGAVTNIGQIQYPAKQAVRLLTHRIVNRIIAWALVGIMALSQQQKLEKRAKLAEVKIQISELVSELAAPPTYPRLLQIQAELTQLIDESDRLANQLTPPARIEAQTREYGIEYRLVYRDGAGQRRRAYIAKSEVNRIRDAIAAGCPVSRLLEMVKGCPCGVQ